MGAHDSGSDPPQHDVDPYLLRERISSTGMGVVWRADQRRLARATPFKLVQPDLETLPDLLSRLCATAHPRAVATIDLGKGAPPLLVMDRVAGTTLAHRLRAGESFSLARAIRLVTQLLAALAEAHAAGMVHADIRPEHVIVATGPDGDDDLTLVDVGGDDDDDLNGAPAYLAPEIIAGARPTVASDLYAVGVILYELVTGSRPFEGASPVEVMTRLLRGTVPPPSLRARIPAALERVTLRALARSPAARFADAAGFAAALEVVAASHTVDRLRVELARAVALGTPEEIVVRGLELVLALSGQGRHAEARAALDAAAERVMWDERLAAAESERLLERLGGARVQVEAEVRRARGPVTLD